MLRRQSAGLVERTLVRSCLGELMPGRCLECTSLAAAHEYCLCTPLWHVRRLGSKHFPNPCGHALYHVGRSIRCVGWKACSDGRCPESVWGTVLRTVRYFCLRYRACNPDLQLIASISWRAGPLCRVLLHHRCRNPPRTAGHDSRVFPVCSRLAFQSRCPAHRCSGRYICAVSLGRPACRDSWCGGKPLLRPWHVIRRQATQLPSGLQPARGRASSRTGFSRDLGLISSASTASDVRDCNCLGSHCLQA
mmetsp:Transcript_110443/g.276486  ORF Transcript_110443/g.276486 Transcript_110443/m.276486 type:complete len:249 (-) Transcript_110443:864-1610(-)